MKPRLHSKNASSQLSKQHDISLNPSTALVFKLLPHRTHGGFIVQLNSFRTIRCTDAVGVWRIKSVQCTEAGIRDQQSRVRDQEFTNEICPSLSATFAQHAECCKMVIYRVCPYPLQHERGTLGVQEPNTATLSNYKLSLSLSGARTQRGPGQPHLDVSISHNDTSQSVGPLWARDRHMAKTSDKTNTHLPPRQDSNP